MEREDNKVTPSFETQREQICFQQDKVRLENMHCLPNLVLRLKFGGEGAHHRWLTDFGRED